MFNKSLITNIIAIILIIVGYFYPIYNNLILTIGIFALSGAITNWIAIHMLFEKIPFLYGSGIISNRFNDFKIAIKNLIINEFFNKQHIEKFFKDNQITSVNYMKKIDFDKIFENLTQTIMESQFGSMLSMFGGKSALDPLKEPVIKKLQEIIKDFVQNNSSNEDISSNIIKKIEDIIDNRLNQLTPKMVKDIISNMIRKHLGWLVIWGGLFGGIVGAIYGFWF
jgi:uncharacterized membrane protein YheB (UPF0754 family)